MIPVNGQLMKFVFHIGKSCSNISQIYVSSLAVQQAGLRALSVSSVTHHHHRCHHSHHLSPPPHLYYSQCLSRAFSWMPLRSPVYSIQAGKLLNLQNSVTKIAFSNCHSSAKNAALDSTVATNASNTID